MKRRIMKRRKDGVRQHYIVGRKKRRNFGMGVSFNRKKTDYGSNLYQGTFADDGAKLDVVEGYPDWDASVIRLHVDESKRKQGRATKLLEKATEKYDSIHSQVSNMPSVRTHFNAGFRLDDDHDASKEETIKKFKEVEIYPGSIGMSFKGKRK